MDDIEQKIADIVSFNGTKCEEQIIDQSFYDDTFEMPGIKSPFKVIRTGTGARIVDGIVTHIQLANPQVRREPTSKSNANQDSAAKVARFCDQMLKAWRLDITDMVKDCVHRGEGIGQIQYNPDYSHETNKGVPLFFTASDPLVTFCDPYDSVMPDAVTKDFYMQPTAARNIEPDFVPDADVKSVHYRSFWDKDTKYISLGDMIKNTQNPYGFTPFVHCYSGFGKKSADGDPSYLAVGRLRRNRDRLREECSIESQIGSIIEYYAYPLAVISHTDDVPRGKAEKSLKDIVFGPAQTVVVPFGFKHEIYTPQVAAAELFQHLYQIRDALGMDYPPLLSGQASGAQSSGRLEDILAQNITVKYSALIQNVELALSKVLGMGLWMLEKIPGALPVTIYAMEIDEKGHTIRKQDTLTAGDIAGNYEVTVKYNPNEQVEADRRIMLYSNLADKGRISWKSFLMDGMGMGEDEAEDEIAQTLAETAMVTDLQLRQTMVVESLKQIGATKEAAVLEEEIAQQMLMAQELQNQPVKQGGRPSEATNPTSLATVRQVLSETPVGVRNAPTTPPMGGQQ